MATSDSQFVCPLNQFGRRYATLGLPVYSYFFTERYGANPWPRWMGVLHGDEIFFVFGEPFRRRDNFTDDERALSRLVIAYWTNFAKTGSDQLHRFIVLRKGKGKVFPYSLPSVGPGADPGVQAVSPQVT